MSQNLNGLTALSGITSLSNDTDYATPEERHGGVVDAAHGNWGEQAQPYSYQSLAMPAASHGPYGAENQLLGDEYWFFEGAGTPAQDPTFDYNAPVMRRSHASVHNPLSEVAPSQFDAINEQTSRMANHASNLGSSGNMQSDQLGYAQQDHWTEIWEINPGDTMLEQLPNQAKGALPMGGFGQTGRATSHARQNSYGYDSKHMHRRFTEVSLGHLPGNYQWMIPQGRVMHRNLPGPARPPVGNGSQFAGDDLGDAFAYHTGAILQSAPVEYVPPPAPLIGTGTPTYDNPLGTDPIELW